MTTVEHHKQDGVVPAPLDMQQEQRRWFPVVRHNATTPRDQGQLIEERHRFGKGVHGVVWRWTTGLALLGIAGVNENEEHTPHPLDFVPDEDKSLGRWTCHNLRLDDYDKRWYRKLHTRRTQEKEEFCAGVLDIQNLRDWCALHQIPTVSHAHVRDEHDDIQLVPLNWRQTIWTLGDTHFHADPIPNVYSDGSDYIPPEEPDHDPGELDLYAELTLRQLEASGRRFTRYTTQRKRRETPTVSVTFEDLERMQIQ